MFAISSVADLTAERRVFEAWSLQVPVTFEEVFVREDSYWHAYDEHRSVSLTSLVLEEGRRPVVASRILERLPVLDGTPVIEMPAGFAGVAATFRPSSRRGRRRSSSACS